MSWKDVKVRDFERVEASILELPPSLDYVSLVDRDTAGRNIPPLAKIGVNATALADYLPFEGEDEEELELDTEEQGMNGAFPAALPDETAPEPLLRAVLEWLKHELEEALRGRSSRRFKFRAYGPKGIQTLLTLFINAEWVNPPEERAAERAEVPSIGASPSTSRVPPPQMLMYPATYQDGTLFGTASAWQQLNEAYRDMQRLVFDGIGALSETQRQSVKDLSTELHLSRSQINHLVDRVLEQRLKEVELRSSQAAGAQASEQRMELAKEAISQFGEAARAFFMSRGMPPELAGVMGTLTSSPALMQVLQDEEVRALLSEPENLNTLASALRQLAEQRRAQRALQSGGGLWGSPTAMPPIPQGYVAGPPVSAPPWTGQGALPAVGAGPAMGAAPGGHLGGAPSTYIYSMPAPPMNAAPLSNSHCIPTGYIPVDGQMTESPSPQSSLMTSAAPPSVSGGAPPLAPSNPVRQTASGPAQPGNARRRA